MPHSMVQHLTLTCLVCRRSFDADIWLIIDTQERPDLLERLRASQIHNVFCIHCGQSGLVDMPLLIFRPTYKPVILFSPAQKTHHRQDEEQARGLINALRQRLGHSWQDSWLEGGLTSVPRSMLASALSDNPEITLQQIAEQEQQRSLDMEQNNPVPYPEELQTIHEFIETESWYASYEYLRTHPQLLTDEVDNVLGLVIQGCKQVGNDRNYRWLSEHLILLRRCREVGITSAFAEKLGMHPNTFIARQQLEKFSPHVRRELEELIASGVKINSAEELAHLVATRPDLQARLLAEINGIPSEETISPQLMPILAELQQPLRNTRDVRQRIALCQQALSLVHQFQNRQLWAVLQKNLGDALVDSAQGRITDNIEQAIIAYQEVLQIRTRSTMPVEWATTMMNLGNAYQFRIRGDQAENIESAITAYQQSLEIMTRFTMPTEWARAVMNLATAYSSRIRGDKANNIEQAIDAYQNALQVRTRIAMPVEWATTMMNLGNAYRIRIRGERAENIEQAIDAFKQALQVRTREAMPMEWAQTMRNLALAYRTRIIGEQAENMEQAIVAFEQALQILTRSTLPVDWAQIMNSLGNTYRYRLQGTRAENIEKAIVAFELALQVITRSAIPVEWAKIMLNLGNAYSDRIQGKRVENIEQAIAVYEQALQVMTHTAMPVEWAQTMNNLALAYSNRILGERTENIEHAITTYQKALTVQTLLLLPSDHQEIQHNLGDLLFKEGRWAVAQVAYQAAIQAGELLLDTAYTELGRQAEVSETAQLYARSAYCFWQSGQSAVAFQQLEQGKTRLLGQALALGEVNLDQQPPAQQQAIRTLRQTIRDLEGEMRLPPDTPARRSDRELAANLQAARSQLSQLSQTIRAEQSDFMPVSLEPATILKLIPEHGALVAPCITSQGSFVLVIPHGCQEITFDHTIALPNLTEETVLTWLRGSSEDPAWVGWLGAYSRQRLNPLQWHNTIQHTLAQVWADFMKPVYERLQSLGVAQGAPIILLPQGRLGLLPLHAAWREVNEQPRAFLDEYTVTYAASAYTLQVSQHRLQQSARQQNSLLMVVNPTRDLTFTPVEGVQVAARFPATTLKQALKETEATEKAVVTATKGKAYLHFSCHGFYNWQNPLESGLILADGERFTLSDIMRRLDLGASRLVVLSACETGLTDIRQTPDEFVGLSAGFMQAGAPAVISTLWAVNDQSTSLLMDRFYQHHIQDNDPPAVALRKAQQWLRQVTRHELGSYYFSYITRHMSAEDASKLHEVVTLEGDPDECPFAHPYHWAGFTYYGS